MYQQKYYTELISQGNTWRLEIYQDTDIALQAIEIGPVLQGLRLIMQGDQADIDTPIVKTSLEMVFVDAPDLEENKKCGYWEEFYTSSATEYQVRLLKNGAVEWTGYVTPDSFSESLQYRGSVTIIARDNLGALQDFEYQATTDDSGLITIENLINKGLEAISFPMSIKWGNGNGRKLPRSQDVSEPAGILSARFNNGAFREKTWQEAIEDVLFSAGLVMRYAGSNTFVISSIRDIALGKYDYWWDLPDREVIFCAYGNRELSPAVKSIREETQFDISENIIDARMESANFGEEATYSYEALNGVVQMPVDVTIGGIFKGLGKDNTILLNPFKYKVVNKYGYGKGGDILNPDVVYVCANIDGGTDYINRHTAPFSINIPAGSYKISFEVNKAVALFENKTSIGYADYEIDSWWFTYRAVFKGADGSIKTLNSQYGTIVGEPQWQDGASTGKHVTIGYELPKSVESPVLSTDVDGVLEISFYPADLPKNSSNESQGGYLGIANFSIESTDNAGHPIMKVLRVTTQFNESNNIILNRSPKFAPNISSIISPKQIVNGIFYEKDGKMQGSEKWAFLSTDEHRQLSVLIHQQILAYYSKPNNVLTGELATEDPLFNALYEWNGKKHLLTSGALNVITGRMENVVLREFTRYDHMWETWVAEDQIEVDYASVIVEVDVFTKRDSLFESDVKNLPLWATARMYEQEGYYTLELMIDANRDDEMRVAIIYIDNAPLRVIQRAAGAYGLDYGEDYS